MIETIVIDRRFRGPPESGNGGYVCGLLGRHYPGGAMVTLRKPPPLGVELMLAGHGAGRLRLLCGDELIAEAEPAEMLLDVPEPPDFSAAVEASRNYIGFADHHFGGCFVCGPDRATGDGLRIFAGSVAGCGLVAAPWTPDESVTDDGSVVKPEFLWAALDCPGYFALHTERSPSLMLLGQFSAQVDPGLQAGEHCTVIGWDLGSEGRKHFAGTALFAETGRLIGKARATWIEVDQQLW